MQLGTPLQVTPHVAKLGRLTPERDIAHLDHDRAHAEWSPQERNSGRAFNIGHPHHRQIRVRAADREPEVYGLCRSHGWLHRQLGCAKDVADKSEPVQGSLQRDM